ncbi:MAG: hypothetical protein RIS28_1364, partial [Bacteroidota bacterium]
MSLPKRIAFVGNPNCGKSTLFNRLTGLTQKTSNLPGTTVEASSGHVNLLNQKIELIDLPGIYSLFTQSEDERLVVQHLAGFGEEKPEALLLVIDSSNLRRVDIEALEKELGIPCIFFNPRKEKDIAPVLELIQKTSTPKLLGEATNLPNRLQEYWSNTKLPGLSEETLRRYINIEKVLGV